MAEGIDKTNVIISVRKTTSYVKEDLPRSLRYLKNTPRCVELQTESLTSIEYPGSFHQQRHYTKGLRRT